MKSKKGISLTEVVMAIGLVAICIGAIVGLVVQSVELGSGSEYAFTAMNLAKNRIERIREIRRDLSYTRLSEMAESDVIVNSDGVPDPNGNFKRTTIIAVDPTGYTGLTKVTVKVQYKRKRLFNPVPIELVTLISPYS
ncbi:MAG: hypothetical protein NC828_03760 [Candidatus Omnitrophica bacterium]|nr:hypothetical protein [Candidatus Omnitrophota bacterium]